MSSVKDRVKGVLLGCAVGDKNHGPIHMALLVAESLVQHKKLDGKDVFDRFVHWYKNGDFGADDTGLVGHLVFDAAIKSPNTDFSTIVEAVDKQLNGNTAGINATHRSIAISMCKSITNDDLKETCQKQVMLTHAHQIAQDTCFIMNYLLRGLILGEDIEHILTQLVQIKFDDQTNRAVKSFFLHDIDRKKYLPNGGFSPETLLATLWFVRKYTKGIDFKNIDPDVAKNIFRDCMEESFLFAGRANYSPVLVGPIMGCLVGASNIEEELYKHCMSPERVLKVCEELAQDWE